MRSSIVLSLRCSSVVEQCSHKACVDGSIPSFATNNLKNYTMAQYCIGVDMLGTPVFVNHYLFGSDIVFEDKVKETVKVAKKVKHYNMQHK